MQGYVIEKLIYESLIVLYPFLVLLGFEILRIREGVSDDIVELRSMYASYGLQHVGSRWLADLRAPLNRNNVALLHLILELEYLEKLLAIEVYIRRIYRSKPVISLRIALGRTRPIIHPLHRLHHKVTLFFNNDMQFFAVQESKGARVLIRGQ